MNDSSTKYGLLGEEILRLEILKGTSTESVLGLLEQCSLRKLEKGDVLIEKGTADQKMYMVLSGTLSIHLEDKDQDPVARVNAGQTVGEISVIDNNPTSAHVIAVEDTRLIEVDEETFWRLTRASHEFAANMLHLLAARMRRSNTAIAENVRQSRHLEQVVMVDGLTGLFNRRWLDEMLSRIVYRYRRDGMPLCAVMIDVDHFKRFNDEYGHAAGDEVLIAVAGALSKGFRPTDFAVRYGGEEFAVLLTNTGLTGALVATERLGRKLSDLSLVSSGGLALPRITASFGVAEATEDEDPWKLLERADSALYRAKRGGRNRVEFDG